jgi:hypothetical protein
LRRFDLGQSAADSLSARLPAGPKEDFPMDSGDMMFVAAVVAAMVAFMTTLFSVTWYVNRR